MDHVPDSGRSRRKYWFFSIAFLVSVIADQASKAWARGALKGRAPVVVVPDYWDFHYSENPGAAFGLFRDMENGRYLLLVIGIIAIGVIISFVRRVRPERVRLAAELGLLAGGAIGNIIDRVLFTRVTDFVLWKAPMEGWLCGAIARVLSVVGMTLHYCEWPTFNVADCALVIGVFALLLDTRPDDMDPVPSPPAAPAPSSSK